MSLRAPRFLIQANVDKVASLMNVHHVPDSTFKHALNAASRGVVRMGLDPFTCEMVLGINERVSPALEHLALECGSCELAGALLHLLGAAVDGELWQAIQPYL
jgi:hypothetical protein